GAVAKSETSMADPRRESPNPLPAWKRYGIAAGTVALALGGALTASRLSLRNTEVPLFLFAVAITAWYGGRGPAAVAVVLSTSFFSYFFTEPLHSLYVSTADLPYFVLFVAFALLIAWFSAVRRGVEADLRLARDKLEIEVAERTQQANLLNL